MGLLAAPEGIAKLTSDHPDVPLFLAAVDERLNEHWLHRARPGRRGRSAVRDGVDLAPSPSPRRTARVRNEEPTAQAHMPKLTLHEIYLAQQRIEPYITRTPLVRSPLLSAQLGCDVWLKLENRQHTGSFKPRGALNKILSLSAEERERGIVAASAGNHALGVAHAAQCLGLTKADLFVQANAAPAKIAKLRQYNVNLHLVGNLFDEAQAAAFEFAEKTWRDVRLGLRRSRRDRRARHGRIGDHAGPARRRYDRRAGGWRRIDRWTGDGRQVAQSHDSRDRRESRRIAIGLSLQTRRLPLRDLRERTDAGARSGRRLRARAVHGRHDADRRDRAGQRRGDEARHCGADRFRSDLGGSFRRRRDRGGVGRQDRRRAEMRVCVDGREYRHSHVETSSGANLR